MNKLQSDWIEKENKEFMQRRHRRYLHFDGIIEELTEALFKKITDPNFIKNYSFFPLIQRLTKTRLYKRNPVTGIRNITAKSRPISYASHFDALIYSWYAQQLNDYYEKFIVGSDINASVIAYRKLDKSNIDFAKEIFDYISSKEKTVAIAFDIKGFYDTLDFKILKKAWVKVLLQNDLPEDHYSIYKSITKFAFVDLDDLGKVLGIKNPNSQKLKPFFNKKLLKFIRSKGIIKQNNEKGIPQGTPISCVLSNIYMMEFDRSILSKVNEIGGLYRRYSDDIIIVCDPEKLDEIRDFVISEITNVNLVIEKTKTEVRFFSKEKDTLLCFDETKKPSKLQYLGVNYDGSNFTLRHKGYASFERRMTKAVTSATKRAHKHKRGVSKKMIYERFTPFGDMNYITYVKMASEKLKDIKIVAPVRAKRLINKIKSKIIKAKQKIEAKELE